MYFNKKVSENFVLRSIFAAKEDELNDEQRKLNITENVVHLKLVVTFLGLTKNENCMQRLIK